jgi:hypothetical protein
MTEKTPEKLRRQAAEIRRAAAVSTSGGRRTDRMLLAVAARLEAEADTIEREAAG